MALRVTQNLMYSSYIRNMNSSLSGLMESNHQSTTQKRINRPSDDAVGTSRVLSYRATLDNLNRYKSNISTAMGWVKTSDSILSEAGSLSTLLIQIKELAQQGATDTYDGDNREQMSYKLRTMFDELLGIANMSYNGDHVFAGHKIDQPAFRESLAITANHPNFANMSFGTEGGAKNTVLIQATSSGNADSATYRYSEDSGATWHAATVDVSIPSPPYPANHMRINAGGASMYFDVSANPQVEAVDPASINENDNGTWFYVRPTAVYQGDDSKTEVVVPATSSVGASVQGYFKDDINVRIDTIEGGMIHYSYSHDAGNNWVPAVALDQGASSRLPVPGGYLELDGSPISGDRFGIHPRRASTELNISEFDSISLNMVGMDIFGGMYQDPDPNAGPGYPTAVPGLGNVFEILGNLIAYAETNSVDGMGKCLAELDDAIKRVSTAAAHVGSKYNRLTMTLSTLQLREFAETDGLSAVEDVDFTELTTRLASQQLAYNTVLKSSSMIMQLSLVNFL